MNTIATDEWTKAREGGGHQRQRREKAERHIGLKLYQAV